MFNLVDIGQRAGSGIPNIFSVWKKQGWNAPTISESFEPERIILSLEVSKASDKNQAIKKSDKTKSSKTAIYMDAIIAYLTDNASAKCSDIATLIGLSIPRTRAILSNMIADGVVVSEGGNRNKVYRLSE